METIEKVMISSEGLLKARKILEKRLERGVAEEEGLVLEKGGIIIHNIIAVSRKTGIANPSPIRQPNVVFG